MNADKLEEAKERFSIMNSQNDINQDYIFSYLAENYGNEIANYIKNKYPGRPAMNGEINNISSNENAPQKPAICVLGDFSTLSKYIEAGIKLTPTKPKTTDGFSQLKTGRGTNQEAIIKIDSLQGLKYWLDRNITRFIFTPKETGLLCIDIDRNHGDGIDGVNNFYSWLKKNGLESIPYFKDIDAGTFPAYVKTPRGGLHLYFSCKADLKTFSKIVPGVEIKYNGENLTAGGSVKNNIIYSLHGELKDAPIIPAPLLLAFSKVLSKPAPIPKKNGYKYQARKKEEYSTNQLLDFARQDSRGGNHDTIFQMGTRLKRAGYSEIDTIKIIEATPEHRGRKDKNDTFTCIKSIYQ